MPAIAVSEISDDRLRFARAATLLSATSRARREPLPAPFSEYEPSCRTTWASPCEALGIERAEFDHLEIIRVAQAFVPVLLRLCFFARRDDFLMPQSGLIQPDGRWSGPEPG